MDKLKVALAHLFSMHTLAMAMSLALGYTASVPSLAAWHDVLLALAGALGLTGFSLAATSDPKTGERPLKSSRSTGPALAIFLAMTMLGGCAGAKAWLACTLGQLPSAAQPALPSIVQALTQDDGSAAVSALETIGLGLLPGQVGCIVKAVQADELAKASKVLGQRSRVSVNIAKNADLFLQKHPATACGDYRRGA